MNLEAPRTSLDRRLFGKAAVAAGLGYASAEAEAIEPLTIAIWLLLGTTAVFTLTSIAEASSYREKRAGDRSFHGDTGGAWELKPDHWGKTLPLPDGGVILCRDAYRTRPPGSTEYGPDLSPAELLACGGVAPYAGTPREKWSDTPADARRKLDAMSELLKEPLQHMRYGRVMTTASNQRYLLRSAVTRDRKRELITLWQPRGRVDILKRAVVSPAWTIAKARDLA